MYKRQDKKQKKDLANVGSQNTQQEDAAMKTLALFFAEELFPLVNIKGKVKRVAPTEIVHLELKKMYQDFNYEMEDNSWAHLEFQSTNEGVQGLKRFRTYEALTSYQYGVAITTYVLFSGNIKNPVTEYSEGINTYRVHPIILQGRNADQLLGTLEAKIQTGEEIAREELVELAMCSLMGNIHRDRVSDLYHNGTGQRCNPDYGIVDRNNCHVCDCFLCNAVCVSGSREIYAAG